MTNSTDPGKAAQHAPQGNAYHSRIEICRILQFLASDRCSVSAEIESGKLFISHILSVDTAGYFVIAYCANKPLNSVLFSLPSLEFTASYLESRIVFRVSNPKDIQFNGQPSIQFAFPQSITLHNRREHPRIPVPEDMSLRCIADENGIISFESRITDISMDGMGGLLYAADIKLETGTILKGCRIIIRGDKSIIADLEVRYTKTITLQDGALINRTGVRFVQRPKGIEELINMFTQNPGNTVASR